MGVPFGGGQHCDEIGAARAGTLRYVRPPPPNGAPMPALTSWVWQVCGPSPPNTKSSIQSVDEPSKCRYSITIHIPALCALPAFKTAASPATGEGGQPEGKTALTLGGVALSYKERCYHFVEGWWTYEFCVNKVTKTSTFQVQTSQVKRHRTSR